MYQVVLNGTDNDIEGIMYDKYIYPPLPGLDNRSIPSVKYLTKYLRKWDSDFIKVCCDRYVKAKLVVFYVKILPEEK